VRYILPLGWCATLCAGNNRQVGENIEKKKYQTETDTNVRVPPSTTADWRLVSTAIGVSDTAARTLQASILRSRAAEHKLTASRNETAES